MANTTKVNLITTVLPDSAADGLEQPPEDLREAFAKMHTHEALISNTTKKVEGLSRDSFMNVVLEIQVKVLIHDITLQRFVMMELF